MAAITINYTPHPYQLEFHKDQSRFRIISGGRRSGKTFSAFQDIMKHCLETPDAVAFWVGTTFREARELGFDLFVDNFKTYKPAIRDVHSSLLKVTFINGAKLFFKGSDNPDSCRGRGLTYLVMDEAAFMRDGLFDKILRPSLSDKMGKVVLTSTPNGRNWFYKTFNKESFKSFLWPTSINPLITKEELESVREEISEIDYRQEYLGHFITKAGQIYADFTDDNIIVPIAKVSRERYDIYLGCDYGYVDPTAVAFMAVDRNTGHVIQFDELSVTRTQMTVIVDMIVDILTSHSLIIGDVSFTYTDPAGNAEELSSGISPVDIMRKRGFKIINKGSRIEPGLAMVRSYVKAASGDIKYKITSNCDKTIECMRSYSYAVSKDGIVKDEPDKKSGWDHLPDAIRYFFVNQFDQARYVAETPNQQNYESTKAITCMKRCDSCKRPFVSSTPKGQAPFICKACQEEK